MAMHTSEEDVVLKSSSVVSLSSAASLRRKSQQAPLPILLENNDEAEKLARRSEISATENVENIKVDNKRKSLGLSFLAQMSGPEIKNRMCECIKLNTENKINVKNAFSLEMIDFMTYMIKRKDTDISNLQMASISLDVSSKIYGFRVDGVYTEIMKMVGALDKQEDGSLMNEKDGDLNDIEKNKISSPQKSERKKKRRNKLKIFSTINSLKGNIEVSKPSWTMENEDSQTTDTLYQVILPNHANSKYYLHRYNDIIVDTVEHKINTTNMQVVIPKIEDFSELEVCPPLSSFEFQGWTSNSENEDAQLKENDENEFQYDLDASLPFEDKENYNEINCSAVEDEVNNIDRCIQLPRPLEKIVDICKIVSNIDMNKTSEYSFLQKSMHWAGPSHWKVSSFTRLMGRNKQEAVKHKKEVTVYYDDSIRKAVLSKFAKATTMKNKITKKEWYEEKLTLPPDTHYNIANATKLYLHKLDIPLEKRNQLNVTNVSDIIENYDYNNENDTSNYCPNVFNKDYEINEDDHEAEYSCGIENGEMGEAVIFTGDNLIDVPKLTNKISIPYSTRAKKIDMRQLKNSIWKCLTASNNNENINTKNQEEESTIKGNKSFTEIYKTLPKMLTKSNTEALSFPISFVSLLHLANEKTLKIQSLPDMSDLIVEPN